MVEQGRLRGVSIYEAIIILHTLEDKYYTSPPAASSQSTLPKCSVLPIFQSLELLNALLFTHFPYSRWVIYRMTWPLAWKGDGFKSMLTRHRRETKRSRTHTSLPRLARPSSANKNCPVGKRVSSWCVNLSSQQMSLLVYELGKSLFIKKKKIVSRNFWEAVIPDGLWDLLACFLMHMCSVSLTCPKLQWDTIFPYLVHVHTAQGRYPMEKMAEEKSQHLLIEGVMMLGCWP